MNILSHFYSGAARSLKLWKWILVIWFSTLLLVSLMVLPLRGQLNNILGSSMITEKLTDGFNIDVFANVGTGLQILTSSLTASFFLVTLTGILINVFFNGGLFGSLRKREGQNATGSFFGEASANFWSFLLIGLLVVLMILSVSFLVVGLPVIVKAGAGSGGSSKLVKIMMLVMLLILPVFLLVADYARAWQAVSEKKNPFTAIGHGFKITFRHFFRSWATMIVVMVIQCLYAFFVFKIAGRINPGSGGGIFLLFILIQILFILKLLLRTWRYGCITSMYESYNAVL